MQKFMSGHGYLKVITGPMFSGKSSQLINIHTQLSARGAKICAINHNADDRYGTLGITTHEGNTIQSLRLSRLNGILRNGLQDTHDVFLIDEGQFFPDLKGVVWLLVNFYKKIVFVAGLSGDFSMKPFGAIHELIAICDEVEKLTTTCACGKTAHFTRRWGNQKDQLVVGSSNYASVCRSCHPVASCGKEDLRTYTDASFVVSNGFHVE